MEKSIFDTLNGIDLKEDITKKDNLSYISWAKAWELTKQNYPNATYEVFKNPTTMLPYFESEIGAMVYTKVTIESETLDMWLPVMNSINKAMKKEPYTYATKYGEKTVEAYTMFDINKTIMRCLTKNLAMFGLGIYLYTKDELNDDILLDDFQVAELEALIESTKSDKTKLLAFFKVKNLDEVDYSTCKKMLLSKAKE
jgi:hypothetical protein